MMAGPREAFLILCPPRAMVGLVISVSVQPNVSVGCALILGTSVARPCFEGADKAAKAFLFLGREADEFNAELLFLCPPNHGLVNLQRELRSTHDVDAHLEIRARVHRRGTSNLTTSHREVGHCARHRLFFSWEPNLTEKPITPVLALFHGYLTLATVASAWGTDRPAPCLPPPDPHVSNLRGGTAVDSRWRSSWIMSSTSCLVRMPLRSSSSTSAEVSHMVEMATLPGTPGYGSMSAYVIPQLSPGNPIGLPRNSK